MSFRALTILGLVLLAPGCAILDITPEPVEGLVPRGGDAARVAPFRRVVMMPFEAAAEDGDQAQELRAALEAEISRRNLFETVPVSESDLVDIELASARHTGTYKTDDLILASRRFGADGVLFGVLTQFRAYPDVRLGLRLYLLDCRNGRVPWATETLLDAGDRLVAQDVHNYHDMQLRKSESLLEHERVLRSPRLFTAYAASRVADGLRNTLKGGNAAPPAALPDSPPAKEPQGSDRKAVTLAEPSKAGDPELSAESR